MLILPERWTRHVWARDSSGNEVPPGSVAAVAWCVGGAVIDANAVHFGERGSLEIPVDPNTRRATQVRAPKRVVAALEAVGIGLEETSSHRIKAALKSAPAKRRVIARAHPTLLASELNDLSTIESPHVLLGLAWTMAALHDELAKRGAQQKTRGAL